MVVILWAKIAGHCAETWAAATTSSEKSSRPKQAFAPRWKTWQNLFNSSAYRIGAITKVIATGKGSIAYEVRWMAGEPISFDCPAPRRTMISISLFSIQVKWRGTPGCQDARERTRTSTPKGHRPSTCCVYQFHHAGNCRHYRANAANCQTKLNRQARHFVMRAGSSTTAAACRAPDAGSRSWRPPNDPAKATA